MFDRGWRTRAGLALVAAVTVGLSAAASPAATGPRATASAPVAFPSVVTGTTAHQIPYTRSSGDTSWTSLGGRLVGPPAVVLAENDPTYYVVLGSNGYLYVRTDITRWSRLSGTTNCGVPAAAATSTHLYVACRGRSNGALYTAHTPLSDAPVISSWKSLGGVLRFPPAIVVQNGAREEVFYVVVGGRYTDDHGSTGNVYIKNDAGRSWERTDDDCAGRPATMRQYLNTESGDDSWGEVFACRDNGGSVSYWYGSDVEPTYSGGILPGSAVGDVAVAMSPDGHTVRIYTQSATSRAAHVHTLTMDSTSSTVLDGKFVGGMGGRSLVTPISEFPVPAPNGGVMKAHP